MKKLSLKLFSGLWLVSFLFLVPSLGHARPNAQQAEQTDQQGVLQADQLVSNITKTNIDASLSAARNFARTEYEIKANDATLNRVRNSRTKTLPNPLPEPSPTSQDSQQTPPPPPPPSGSSHFQDCGEAMTKCNDEIVSLNTKRTNDCVELYTQYKYEGFLCPNEMGGMGGASETCEDKLSSCEKAVLDTQKIVDKLECYMNCYKNDPANSVCFDKC